MIDNAVDILLAEDNEKPVRLAVLNLAQTVPTFKWAEGMLSESTTKYVFNKLKIRGQSFRFAPWLVEDHLRECSTVLNNCVDRLSEIKNLESQAIFQILDTVFTESNITDEYQIQKTQLQAAVVQSGGPDEVHTNLTDKFRKLSKHLVLRKSLFKDPDSALNYSVRVNFLRDLLADDIGNIRERMVALEFGLKNSFGITVKPLPVWKETGEPLIEFVRWVRSVRDAIDDGDKTESVQTLFFHLIDGNVAEGVDEFKTSLASDDAATVRFTLTEKDFPSDFEFSSVRILAIGIASVYEDLRVRWSQIMGPGGSHGDREYFQSGYDFLSRMRSTLSNDFTIRLPDQAATIGDLPAESISWNHPSLFVGGVGPWNSASLSKSIELISENQIHNANPIGQWSIRLEANASTVLGLIKKNVAGAGFPIEIEQFQKFGQPRDVIVALRVAVRKIEGG